MHEERVDRVRVQRPIAEDPHIDQILVASLPGFNPVWPTYGEITTYFGEVGRYSPRGHAGLDVAAPQGTPILAADQGEVLKAYWNTDGYGGLVIIGHPSGYETWYGHLVRFDVEQGEQVKRGELIGLMGSTGLSTGPHVHFEVRQDGQLCDPLKFLNEANLKPADW
jgi:murein DD-endopeptidase MepM/ murein hydrolase activator NlpD